MFDWSEGELETLGWCYASDAMLACETRPGLWPAWVAHARSHINPARTTDTKMGAAFNAFAASFPPEAAE